jgi:hypothetical protein
VLERRKERSSDKIKSFEIITLHMQITDIGKHANSAHNASSGPQSPTFNDESCGTSRIKPIGWARGRLIRSLKILSDPRF